MNFNRIENVYFIGIGGIGMSNLAQYFYAQKKQVAGYDKAKSDVTDLLENLKIKVIFEEKISQIPQHFLDPSKTMVIYTPAISDSHEQFSYFKKNNFNIYKRSEVLGMITKNSFCLAVAGTHGKTTTSAILSHIMTFSKTQATCFLGGILKGYNSNLILQKNKITVVEADEYDRSFLQLFPDIACVTSMDADHLDIYENHQNLIASFQEFSKSVSQKLIVKKGLPLKGITYGIQEKADYEIHNIKIENGTQIFDVKTPTTFYENVSFDMPGKHNLLNALAAIAMADSYGIAFSDIVKALQNFKGIQRRFNFCIKNEKVVLIDDYAHHPTEIKAVLEALNSFYPDKKKCVVFQPHLFSRTRDFEEDFAKVLSGFQEVLLLDIYPARELPIKGIHSQFLLEKITTKNKKLVSKKMLLEAVLKSKNQVFAILGAGDIGLMVKDIQKVLEFKFKI